MDDHFIEKNSEPILKYLVDLVITNDKLIRESSCILLKTLIYKCRTVQLLHQIIPKIFHDLDNLNEDSEQYANHLKFFDAILETNIEDKLNLIGEYLLEEPLTQYKLDILMNNSETFGPLLYQISFLEDGIRFLFDELLSPGKYNENIQTSILYCIKRLSISMDGDNLGEFFTNCYQFITSTNLKYEINKIYYGLEILDFFFQKATQNYFKHIDLAMNHLSLYFASDDPKILGLVSSCLKSILNSLEQEQYFEVIKFFNKYIDECLQISKKSDTFELSILSIEHGLDPYYNMIVHCLVYGPVDIFEQALTTYEYVVDNTKKSILEGYALKLVGPLIRVALYKYENELKLKIIENILKFEEKGISLTMFLPQLQTIFFRMVTDYNEDHDYINGVARGFNLLIKYSMKKDSIYNELFNKFLLDRKIPYLYCVYYITKHSINNISKALVDIVLEKLFNYSDLNPNDNKIKYISETISIIASHDNKNRQKELLKKLTLRLQQASNENYFNFSHFLYFLRYIDITIINEEFNEGNIGSILSNFFKNLQLQHLITESLELLRKAKISSNDKRDILDKVIRKIDLRNLFASFSQNEEVAMLLGTLYNN